jgi:hypothetical protein
MGLPQPNSFELNSSILAAENRCPALQRRVREVASPPASETPRIVPRVERADCQSTPRSADRREVRQSCPSREKHTSIRRQKSRRRDVIAAVSVTIELMTTLVIDTAMATRQQRISAFIHEGDPPANQPLELLCEDHVGTYVIPFLCRLSSGAWESVDTGSRIEATVIGWRVR